MLNLIPRRQFGWLEPVNDWARLDKELSSFLTGALARGGDAQECCNWAPAVDIEEEADRYVIKADVPGLEKKDIEVSFDEGVLSIKGEKKAETKERKKGWSRIERFYGQFYRQIALPQAVDESKIDAQYKNGVLELSIPKKEEAKAKTVKVEVK